jgi:hypothetical protein
MQGMPTMCARHEGQDFIAKQISKKMHETGFAPRQRFSSSYEKVIEQIS